MATGAGATVMSPMFSGYTEMADPVRFNLRSAHATTLDMSANWRHVNSAPVSSVAPTHSAYGPPAISSMRRGQLHTSFACFRRYFAGGTSCGGQLITSCQAKNSDFSFDQRS